MPGIVNNGARNGLGDHRNNSTGHLVSPNGGRRGPPPARHAWSYGPGLSVPAYGQGQNSDSSAGPRSNIGMRRTTSGNSSVGSGSTGHRTPGGGDEASSTAVSLFRQIFQNICSLLLIP